MWKCDKCENVEMCRKRHFERSLEAKRRDEVRNLVPFIGTKYMGIGMIYLDVNG